MLEVQPASHTYELYGLCIHSEIPLPAPTASEGGPPWDLHVRWGERRDVADLVPAGEVLAQLIIDDRRGYTLVDDGSGYTYRFHHTGDFRIARDLHSVSVHLSPHVQLDFAGLLLTGNVMAALLALRGEPVLHASAVEMEGVALAFMGASGMGKSSLAASLCTSGARLITDDLLRLQPDGDGWRCYPGTGSLRLREHAAVLAAGFPAEARSMTADNRIGIATDVDGSLPPLRAIIIPLLSRTHDALTVERIPTAKSLMYLMAYPRISETARGERLQRRLALLGRIAAQVPVYEAKIPWGLPLPQAYVSALVREVLRRLT